MYMYMYLYDVSVLLQMNGHSTEGNGTTAFDITPTFTRTEDDTGFTNPLYGNMSQVRNHVHVYIGENQEA